MQNFQIGDIIYIPNTCSLQSMVYYGEHKKDRISCPCSWTRMQARVTKVQQNFIHVIDLIDANRKTVFYHSDISLVRRAVGAEDGSD